MKRIVIKAGQVWVTRRSKNTSTPTRTVLCTVRGERIKGLRALGDVVFRGDSGHESRKTRREAFVAWIRRHDAKATRTRRPRSLVLR